MNINSLMDMSIVWRGEDSIEQFAITTVEKCIHLIMMDYCNNGDEWDRALDNSVHNIKEYFGLKDN